MKKSVFIIHVMILSLVTGAWAAAADLADAAGVKGGFVVCVGCEKGRQFDSLRAKDGFVVQGLDDDPAVVGKMKERIRAAGTYGKVSVGLFDGKKLPYVESLVNLLVVCDAGELSANEVRRVLVPGGMVLIKDGQKISGIKASRMAKLDGWKVFRKPWPDEIDEWTHFLHDAQGTSLSEDLIAGHPRGMRWTGGPFWARSHEHTASLQAMVSAAGRIFYVLDETIA